MVNREQVDKMLYKLWSGKINLPDAASYLGWTNKEMRMTLTEYCKHNPPIYTQENNFTCKSKSSKTHQEDKTT